VSTEPVDEALADYELRARRLDRIGYTEEEAAMIALTGRDLHELEDEIADLQRRGCDPKLAREIAR
jgi:hypothetical protein